MGGRGGVKGARLARPGGGGAQSLAPSLHAASAARGRSAKAGRWEGKFSFFEFCLKETAPEFA